MGKEDRRQKLSIRRSVGEGQEHRQDGQRLPGEREMPGHPGLGADGTLGPEG